MTQRIPQVAVGVWVHEKGRALLIQRGKEPSKGQWALPGGRIHLGETLEQAAERETLEETGLVVRAGAPIFVFDDLQRNDDGEVQFHCVIIDLAAEYVSGVPAPGDDALQARWVAPEEIATLDVQLMTKMFLTDIVHFLPPSNPD